MNAGGAATAQAASATDRDLVRAVRADDDCAFEELYRRYREPITRFVCSFVRDEGRAEDVTQEAFVSALRRIRQTDCDIRFKPWIHEIARNAAIDHHRRSRRAQEVPLGVVDGGLATMRPTAAAVPEASFLEKERLAHLRDALGELSETAQRIVVMREFEGLSYREIGRRTGLSQGAVESALFRARRKLEREYRRRAHGLGARPARSRRLGALLPFPGLLGRLGTWVRPADAPALLSPPAGESLVQGMHKVAVVVASAIAIGGGGATLGGVGPLATGTDRTSADREAAPAGVEAATRAGRQERPAAKERRGAGGQTPARVDRPDGDAREPGAPATPRAGQQPSDAPRSGSPEAGPGAPSPSGPALPTVPLPEPAAPRLPALPDSTPSLPEAPELPDATSLVAPDAAALPTQDVLRDVSAVTDHAVGLVPPD